MHFCTPEGSIRQLWAVVWVLGFELRTFRRVVSALKRRAPAHLFYLTVLARRWHCITLITNTQFASLDVLSRGWHCILATFVFWTGMFGHWNFYLYFLFSNGFLMVSFSFFGRYFFNMLFKSFNSHRVIMFIFLRNCSASVQAETEVLMELRSSRQKEFQAGC